MMKALGFKRPECSKDEKSPSVAKVIQYLRVRVGTERDHAKEYIEQTPRQIDTDYRRRIEAAWDGRARA
jgi:hypothetical protein